MSDYCQKERSQSQSMKVNKIVDCKKTHSNLENQLKVVRKILSSMSWLNNEMFADSIVYQISKFIFRNPISFTTLVFKHVETTKLKIDSHKSYILVNSHFERHEVPQCEEKVANNNLQKNSNILQKLQKSPSIEYRHINCFKQGQYAINIKVVKVWKSCKINPEKATLRQIIAKSKHFIDFLKNIKIDHPKHQNDMLEKEFENKNFEDIQNKIYTLVCQNYDYILNQICKIQQNQKHKKLDHSIAKTYVEMMNKNILILNVEKNNFNPISYKSQGKYIYFENSLQLQLASQKYLRVYSHLQNYKIDKFQQKLIPYLKFCSPEDEWQIKNAGQQKIQLFQESGKQTDRSQGLIMDRMLNCYHYDDYLVREL